MLDDYNHTERAFVAAINSKDWPALRQLVAPAFTRHSVAAGSPALRSVDDLVSFLEREYATFPDASETIDDIIAEGSRVAARHRFRGTQTGPMGPYPPSGRVLDATYLAIYRLENGVIAEGWAEWDTLAGLRQLGHEPRAWTTPPRR